MPTTRLPVEISPDVPFDKERCKSTVSVHTNNPSLTSWDEEAAAKPLLAQHGNQQTQLRPVKKTELYGYMLMTISAITFSLNSVLVHVAEYKYSMKPSTSVFVRSLLQALLSSLFILLHPSRSTIVSSLTSRQIKLLIFRGVVGGIALILLFKSFEMISVGDTVAIFSCTPAFTLVFSFFVLSEPLGWFNSLAALISLAGVVLITRSENQTMAIDNRAIGASTQIMGSLMALSSAALTAVVYTTVRYLGSSIHFMTSVFSMGFFACVMSTVLGGSISPSFVLDNLVGVVVLFMASLCGFLAQSSINKGLQLCQAGPGVLVRNVEVPLVYLIGVFVLGERSSIVGGIGACCVVFSGLMIGIRKMWL